MPLSFARSAMASGSQPLSNPFFLTLRLHLSPSLRRRNHQPARSWRLLKSTSTGEGWGSAFCEGRETADANQFSKKKIMKTTKKLNEGLLADTANRVPPTAAKQTAAPVAHQA